MLYIALGSFGMYSFFLGVIIKLLDIAFGIEIPKELIFYLVPISTYCVLRFAKTDWDFVVGLCLWFMICGFLVTNMVYEFLEIRY